MPSVQIKNVPEQTHAVLRERAARSHQSLQEYLLHLLVAEAAMPTIDEVFDRIEARPGASLRVEVVNDALHGTGAGRGTAPGG